MILKADYNVRGNEIFYRGYVLEGKGKKRFKSKLPHLDYGRAMQVAKEDVTIVTYVLELVEFTA